MNSTSYALLGWVFAQVEGKTYMGKPSEGWPGEAGLRLSPIYEFAWMAVPTPQGLVMQPNLKYPFGCTSLRALTLPRPGVWVFLSELDPIEKQFLAKLVETTEEAMRRASAEAAGITLAPAGTKPPPMQPMRPGGNGRR